MILQKQEIRNNSPEQVREYLVDALNLTVELDPPISLAEHVFNQAVALLSGKQIVVEQMQTSPNGLQMPR